ncbi:MAG: hypothetical protein KME18_07635 [Phormidium tanganyikae FI6-MK23]|nr:hypothetical protein [Phormidium tanganyikae FI6-MK23]
MNYKSDDGSTFGGVFVVCAIVLAFCAGYWVREQGVRFSIDIPKVERRVNK